MEVHKKNRWNKSRKTDKIFMFPVTSYFPNTTKKPVSLLVAQDGLPCKILYFTCNFFVMVY